MEVTHFPLEHVLKSYARRTQPGPALLPILVNVVQAHQLLVAQDLADHGRDFVDYLLLLGFSGWRFVEGPQVALLGLEVEVEELTVHLLVVLGQYCVVMRVRTKESLLVACVDTFRFVHFVVVLDHLEELLVD